MIITVIPDDLTVPEFLRREDTPESREAREQIARMYKNRFAQKLEQEKQKKLLSDGEATEKRIEDEADRRWRNWLPTLESRHRPTMAHYRNEVREEFAAKRKQRERTMAKELGSKEKALRATRENGNGKEKGVLTKLARDAEAAAKKAAAVSDEAKLAAALTASTNGAVAFEAASKAASNKKVLMPKGMKKKVAKVLADADAKAAPKMEETKATKLMEKAAKANGAAAKKADGPKPKMQIVEDLLLREKGATADEVLKKLAATFPGWKPWKSVDMGAQERRRRKTNPKAKLVDLGEGRFKLSA